MTVFIVIAALLLHLAISAFLGTLTLSSGITVSGYIVTLPDNRQVVCQDEDLAKRFVDSRVKRNRKP